MKKGNQTVQIAATVLDLAQTSKRADIILKQVKLTESKNMKNEVSIEEQDKSCKEAAKMKRDSEHKLEELSRRLGVMEVSFHIMEKYIILQLDLITGGVEKD